MTLMDELMSHELCDLHEGDTTGTELDEEDAESLLSDAYLVLGRVLEENLDETLHAEVLALVQRMDGLLSWHELN